MTTNLKPAPGEKYTVRRKVFKLFGAAFHIYGPEGNVVGFCDQKAFKLREDLRVYTDETKASLLLRIHTEQIIDFGATYKVTLPDGSTIGAFRRGGMASTFYKDSWYITSPDGREVAKLTEDSGALAILRKFTDFGGLFPQKFTVTGLDGEPIATLRTHFNLFIYRLGVAIHRDHPDMDELMVIALACAVAAIEGRQD
ncbi:MAG: hypothetical protein ACKVZJ_08095 [Phycisphaerales bacterium]